MIILSGRYLVGELVYGDPAVAVHRGHDQVLDRAVTIELLQPGAGAEVATALRDKARRMALVELPHVAALYDQGDEEGRPYLVLEELLGEALADVAPLPSAGAASLVSSLATTLAAAHERRAPVPRVDRGSVRVVDDDRIQIIDWGVSQ